MHRHNERTRAKVLDAYGSVLAEQGFESATMAEAAERAGMARSSVYRHFPDKESLFFSYLEDRVTAFVEALSHDVPPDRDATDRLRRLVVAELRRFDEIPVAITDVPESLTREGRVRLQNCFEPLRALAREILEQGRREGSMGALEADNALDLVFACIDASRAQLARQFADPDAIAGDIADFVLRGLGVTIPPPPRAKPRR